MIVPHAHRAAHHHGLTHYLRSGEGPILNRRIETSALRKNGEEFDVPFADDAEIPGNWQCRNGLEGTLIEGNLPEPKKVKPPRTHWDMLLERRSIEELDELLKERLDLIKTKRRG